MLTILLCAAPLGPVDASAQTSTRTSGRASARTPARTPARASAQTAPRAQPRPPVAIVLQNVPKRLGPNSAVTISGYLKSQSNQQLNGLSVRLRWRGHPMYGRAELAQYAGSTAPALPTAGQFQPLTGPLAPGQQVKWTLKTTARRLGMTAFGVYPIAVEVLSGGVQSVAAQTTFVPFTPSSPAGRPQPTQVAWVWPMIDRPHRTTDTTYNDDQLNADLAADGRLGRLLEVGRQAGEKGHVPLTWAVDPALLDDVDAMTRDYRVREGKTGRIAKRPKSKTAETWLAGMRALGDPYFSVPYADPDSVALIGARLDRHLRVAYDDMTVSEDVLKRPATDGIGWPVGGAAGPQTLNFMAGNDTDTFVMSSEVLFSPDPHGYTVDATSTLPTGRGAKRALVYDATISDIISGDTRAPGAAVLAEQRFLAETAMITAEQPNRPRTLLIAPQRRWDPTEKFAKDLLTYTAAAPWLKEVPLSRLQRAAPVKRTFAGYPSTFENDQIGTTYLRIVQDIAARANRFAGIFDEERPNAFERSVLRMESSYWRGRERRARSFRQAVGKAIDDTIDEVHLVTNERIGLAGSSGPIPITVANDLPDGTVNVVLRVTSQNPGRLAIGGGVEAGPGRRQWTLKIRSRQKETVYLPIEVNANGYSNLLVELLAPPQLRKFDDQKAHSRTIVVHTTGYARLALIITGSAFAVLFIGIAARVFRLRRRNGAGATE